MIAQLAKAVFDNFPPGFYFVVAMTGIILILAANTAFNGFPVLGSILATDGYCPAPLGSRGDRLAYSNGILFLAGFAIVLIVAFDAQTTRLIQLYIVGVFVSFNLSQLGMIRHWTRHLKTETDPADAAADVPLAGDQHLRPGHDRGRVRGRPAHQVPGRRLDRDPRDGRLLRDHEEHPPPLRHGRPRSWRPTTRTGSCRPGCTRSCWSPSCTSRRCARWPTPRRPGPTCSRRSTSTPTTSRPTALVEEWDERNASTSPSRCSTRRTARSSGRSSSTPSRSGEANPRGVVAVYIPEYVVGHWWEQLLHNQTALRLKGRLLFTPGVMVTSVPYQLQSSQIARAREERERPGQGRRPASRRGRRAPGDDRQVPR